MGEKDSIELTESKESSNAVISSGVSGMAILKHNDRSYELTRDRLLTFIGRLSVRDQKRIRGYIRKFVSFRDNYEPVKELSKYDSPSDIFDEMVAEWTNGMYYRRIKHTIGLIADDVIGIHSNRLVLDLLSYTSDSNLRKYEDGMRKIISKSKLPKGVNMEDSFGRLMNFYNSKIKLDQIDKGSELQIRFGCNTCPMYYNNTCPYGLKKPNGEENEQQATRGGCNERYGFYVSTAMMFNTDIPAVITDHLIELKNKARDMTIDDLKHGKTSREYVQIHSVIAMLESKLLDVHRRTKTKSELKASFEDIRKVLLKESLIKDGTDRNDNNGTEGKDKPEVRELG